MKKFIVVLLLLSLTSTLATFAEAQDRPRRVGTQTNPPTTPAPTSPARPPVLGGSNYPTNRQPAPQQDPVQQGPEEVDAGDVIRVNTTLVTIPVSVMDRDGRYVPNLRKEDFRLWEDGVEQDVAFFASVDKPFSVVLMLDTSPSTKFRMDEIQDAAISFINQLRPDDKVMVVEFNDHINILSELTGDRRKLERAIRRADTGDGTRLYDAVDLVINRQLSHIQGRKAIVLFTDGVDTTSKRATYQSNVMDAQELDALIYPVKYDTSADVGSGGGGPNFPSNPNDVWGQILGGIFGGGRRNPNNRRGGGGGGRGGGGYPGRRDPRGGEYAIADQYLREMAEGSGGREYQADSLQNMTYAFANVAEELRRQYSIGYYPKRPAQAGQRRYIKVRANEPNLAVRTRDSYIFNPNGGAVVDNGPRNNAPVLKNLTDRDRTF
jgi:Ca-activated chloride channel homolog